MNVPSFSHKCGVTEDWKRFPFEAPRDLTLASQQTQLARNSQTSMIQGLDQRRQLAPLEIRESAAAGECGHHVPVVIGNGTGDMAMFVGRLLVVDREPSARPASTAAMNWRGWAIVWVVIGSNSLTF